MKWILQIGLATIIFTKTLVADDINILIPPDEPCPRGLVFYPSDDNYTTLICDCSDDELQLYDPQTDMCFYPYSRGPCDFGDFFVLPKGETVADCVENSCVEDAKIPFQGGCYSLGDSKPCPKKNTFLTIELRTLELKCLEPQGRVAGFRYTIYGGIIDAPLKECRKGSRRIFSGKCKRELD